MVIFLFLSCPNAYKRITHGFRPAKCLLNWPYNPKWETHPLSLKEEREIQTILQENFTYFAKGKQCFVFLSEDGKHVLKLFRFDACKMPYGQKIAHRIKKWQRGNIEDLHPLATEVPKVLNSCKIAYDLAADLTGLILVHLNPKKSFLPMLQIKDRLGRNHELDPADYRLILQKTCEPFMSALLKANSEERNRLISSFSQLIERLGDLGLKNIDPRLTCNFGFLNGQAIAIDIGNYVYDPVLAKEDKAVFLPRLNRCLEKKLKPNTKK